MPLILGITYDARNGQKQGRHADYHTPTYRHNHKRVGNSEGAASEPCDRRQRVEKGLVLLGIQVTQLREGILGWVLVVNLLDADDNDTPHQPNSKAKQKVEH